MFLDSLEKAVPRSFNVESFARFADVTLFAASCAFVRAALGYKIVITAVGQLKNVITLPVVEVYVRASDLGDNLNHCHLASPDQAPRVVLELEQRS